MFVEQFKPLSKNTLRDFVTIRLPSGLIPHDVSVHVRDGKARAMPPGRAQIGKEGVPICKIGKLQYTQSVSFADQATQERFSNAVIAAVRSAFSEALAE